MVVRPQRTKAYPGYCSTIVAEKRGQSERFDILLQALLLLPAMIPVLLRQQPWSNIHIVSVEPLKAAQAAASVCTEQACARVAHSARPQQQHEPKNSRLRDNNPKPLKMRVTHLTLVAQRQPRKSRTRRLLDKQQQRDGCTVS